MTRKQQKAYHHGDLPRALLREAVRVIDKEGVSGLTLRGVGQRLGVSRTALYRHFADKSSLLAAVAAEGFRTLRVRLSHEWDTHGGGQKGLEAMGVAYVRFAVSHPAHYRVMFGGYINEAAEGSPLAQEGGAAFRVLVDAIVALQTQRAIRRDQPQELAQYIWATVHGIAMLAIDGQLQQPVDTVIRFANQRMRASLRMND